MSVHAVKREIAAKLDLEAAADADARAGLPSADAKSMSGNESEAMAEARDFGGGLAARLDEHRRRAEQSMENCAEALRMSRLRRKRAVSAAPSEKDPNITRAALDNAITAYNQFKRENGLRRDASDDDRLAQFMWVAVVIMAESALNSHFFAPASGRGLFGGFATAFFISVVNVGFAFLGGVLGLRYAKNHCSAAANLSGLAGFLACCAVCLAMISLAALYRGRIEEFGGANLDSSQIAAQASAAAVENLFAADLGALFSSVESMILFFAGVLCAVAGAWKGYEYDDPYPGFGTMWRQKEDADARHSDAVRANNELFDAWLRNAGGDIRQAENALRGAVGELNANLGGMGKQSEELASAPEDAAILACALLQIYRARNAGARASAAPRYFAEFPTAADFAELSKRCAAARAAAAETRDKAESLLQECREEFGDIRKVLGPGAS